MRTQNLRLLFIVCGVCLLMCVPIIAMHFTDEVAWSFTDFVVAGVLLLGTGLSCEFILRRFRKPWHRLLLCSAVLLVLLLVWAELAVGVFGTPFAGS